MTYWTESLGRIEINIKMKDAHIGSHQGQCDDDINYLLTVPYIKKQLEKIRPELIAECLKELGAWDAEELSNHEDNLSRLLWVACGDLVEGI
jgi:hypothetical protein